MTDTTTRRYTRDRERTDEQETEESETDEQVVCPECGGNLASDTEHGETVCEDCGLVVEEDEIDPGPEWRAFDSREKDEKSRVGAPTTNMTRGLTRPSYDFSLRALSGDQVQWTAHFDEAGRTGSRPWLTSDTVVTEANGVLRGVDRKQGAERWSLTNDDIESEIKIRPPLSSSSSGKLKILNVIRDTVYCVTRFGMRQEHSALVAIDGRTGEITWTNQDYNASPYNLAVAHEHDDTIVFNNRENDLVTSFVALDQDSGTEAWQFAAPGTTGGDRSIGSEFVFVTSEECIVFDA